MAASASNIPMKSLAMNGGDDVYSYSRNSFLQKRGLEIARTIMIEVILEKLDVKSLLSSSRTFVIADLGCSVGPNTFFVVQNIVETVIQNCSLSGFDAESLEFQAFLNDRASNDFNTLFRLLPSKKPYHVAAVPGSFHGRLFPKASLHLIHSSYSIQWLSQVPKQVQDKTSPAWNKGRIYIVDAPEDVAEAYRQQYMKDMEIFLDARADELIPGGLMALFIPVAPTNSKCTFYGTVQLLEAVLVELVTAGLMSEEMLDSFNMPYYHPSSAELEAVVVRDGRYVIEKTERVVRTKLENSEENRNAMVMHVKAGWEGAIKAHFGEEIIEPLFERFKKRVNESSFLSVSIFVPTPEMLFVLKRL